MEGVIGRAFAHELEAGRDRFNARFAQARRAFPGLDGSAWLDCLRHRVDPIVSALEGQAPDRLAEAVESLHDTALELFARTLIGPGSRIAGLEALWAGLLTGVAGSIARAPRALIAPLSNALYNLCTTPRCRPEAWCRAMAALAGPCAGPEHLLATGQVAAWLCGLAHYREAALSRARELPEPIRKFLWQHFFGTPAGRGEWLDALAADPWLDPSQSGPPPLRIAQETGGFRGFGGEFLRPPRVVAVDDSLYVGDGERCWLLFADAFGSVFQRVPGELPDDRSAGPYTLGKNGTVQSPRGRQMFSELSGARSSAATRSTLAVTLPHSHRVFLVAGGLA